MPQESSFALDPAILAFYDRRPEEDRLQRGLPQLEALRTRRLIERYAPAPPATILDIGGAAGAYAGWLAETGYTVHLIDPVPRLVEEARRRSTMLEQPIASCEVGDARTLAFESGVADVVLLLGPLYHLTTAADRARALTEAMRVLRPGGILFAAAMSRWATALDCLARDRFRETGLIAAVEHAVREGQHQSPDAHPGYFTTAYLHHPDELRTELAQARLIVEGLHGLEGPNALLADFDERWADPRRRADMIRIAEWLGAEPSLLGVSPHLLAVARKPG